MKKIILIPILLCYNIFSVYSQERKTWQELKADADNFINTPQVNAALASTSNGDMYFEGTGVLMGLYRVWQATGDFTFLDKALDIAERDIAGAVDLDEFYSNHNINHGAFDTPKFPYKGNIMLPNYWRYNTSDDARYITGSSNPTYPPGHNIYSPPFNEYLNYNQDTISPQNTTYSYNYMEAANAERFRWRHYVLDENIYYRYVADMCRIMFNNPSILTIVSGNGKTYQSRMNDIVSYIEINIWEKWVEYRIHERQLEWYVHRNKTHMSNHLASTALSLSVITGKQKYKDFVNNFLYDFVNPDNPGKNIASGVGFLDVINIQNNRAVWSSNWALGGDSQDISHAGNEINFLIQCFEEEYGSSSIDGSVKIDEDLLIQISNTLKENVIIGDPRTSTQVSYRLSSDQTNWFNKNQYAQGLHDMAQFDEDLLYFLNNNMPVSEKKMGGIGDAIYASRIFDNESPVYPSNGENSGKKPINNKPNVIIKGHSELNLYLGDPYIEEGAEWHDIQDGRGTIENPTTGSVNVNNPGTYILTYSYSDEGELTDTATRTITVKTIGNNCPTISLNGNRTVRLEIELNSTYTEEGAIWVDEEDGTGDAVISGDVVDTSRLGTYSIKYSYTDSSYCTKTILRNVIVLDSSKDILYSKLEFVNNNSITVDTDYIGLPPVIREPFNTTQTYFCTSSSNPEVAFIDENGALNAIAQGITFLTIYSCDGSNLSDTIMVEVSNLPVMNVNDVTADEGDSLEFVFTLSKPSLEQIDFTVIYDNQTTNNRDYIIGNSDVSFLPGEVKKTIVVATIDDLIEEQDETFSIEMLVQQPNKLSKNLYKSLGTILNNDVSEKLKAYPNPTIAGSNINISGIKEGTYQLSIYNFSGNLLDYETIYYDGSEFHYEFPNVIRGIYVLNIRNEYVNHTNKIIIQ